MNLHSQSVVHVQDVQNLSASVSSVAANSRFPVKIAVKFGSGTFYAREGSHSPLIPVDFWSALADTSCNTPVPPLTLVGEAHLGWVYTRSTHSPCHSRLAVTHIKGEFLFCAPPNFQVEGRT